MTDIQMTDIEIPESRIAGATADAPTAMCAECENKIANLETALRTNRRIGMAIGIVMAQHRCTDVEAFDRLRRLSQHRNRKLRELAEEVIYTGALPA